MVAHVVDGTLSRALCDGFSETMNSLSDGSIYILKAGILVLVHMLVGLLVEHNMQLLVPPTEQREHCKEASSTGTPSSCPCAH